MKGRLLKQLVHESQCRQVRLAVRQEAALRVEAGSEAGFRATINIVEVFWVDVSQCFTEFHACVFFVPSRKLMVPSNTTSHTLYINIICTVYTSYILSTLLF